MAENKKSSIAKRSSCYLLNVKQPGATAKRLKLSFQRVAATVLALKAGRSVEASVGFLDISQTGAGIFTPELLHKGSMVELCLSEPMVLKVRGLVAWSVPVSSGVHGGKFRCRSGIQFVFENDLQRQSVQEFVQRAGQDPVENMLLAKAVAPAPTELSAASLDQSPPTPVEAGPAPSAPGDAALAPPPVLTPAAPSAEAGSSPLTEAPAPAPETPPVEAAASATPASPGAPAPETPDGSGQQQAA